MTKRYWEHFPHPADVGVRGVGESIEEAFEEAAMALTAVIIPPETLSGDERVKIHCEAPDVELLLVDWLNALIYEMAVTHLLFHRFEVHIEDGQLNAVAVGERIDRLKHRPTVEVKGATYTELYVAQKDGHWIAQCVVDV